MIEGQLANFENETWYEEMVRNLRLMDYVNTLAAEWTTRLQGRETFQNSTSHSAKLLKYEHLGQC